MIGRENIWRRRAVLLGVSGLLLAANLAFFLWYRATVEERQRALENHRIALDGEAAAAETEAAKVSAQRDRLSQVSAALSEFYKHRVGPRRETLAPTVEELHNVLERIGVNPTQISYATAAVTDLPLTRMDIGFSFRNDYGKFKELLAALESERRWIVVREVGLSRDTERPGGVQVQMKLATYFAGEENPTRPGAKAASAAAHP